MGMFLQVLRVIPQKSRTFSKIFRFSLFTQFCSSLLLSSANPLLERLFTHFPDSAIRQRFSKIQCAARHCPTVVVLPAQQQNFAARIEQGYGSRWFSIFWA
jgi:hypothetical protein